MIDKIKILILTLCLVLFCVISSEDLLIYHGHWLYLIQLLGITLVIYNKENNYLFFFSPTFLTLAYLNLSYFMGQYVIARGIGYDLRYYNAFSNYESLRFITIYFLLCNLTVFLALNIKRFNNLDYTFIKQSKVNYRLLIFLFTILLLFTFIKVDLRFIGGSEDHSYAFQLTTSIFIVNILSNTNKKIKYVLYLLMMFIFIIGSYESKREILFVLILIIFFETIKNKFKIKFNIKKFLYSILLIILFVYIILISSIMRGYGNFNVDNPFKATFYIGKYLGSSNIKNTLTANFELSTAYGNTSNAIDYVYKGEVDHLYGYTFTKFLFIPVPRDVFPDKPRSMIDIYTTKFAPFYRDQGGSLPVGLYGESFWNFNLMSFLFIYLMFSLFNNIYSKVVLNVAESRFKNMEIFIIYMYITLIMFVRGSGLDLWLLYPLISFPLIILLNYIDKILTKTSK